jgi:glyoxylase-like metal-dependent hydrolase (beta-lactamase superfamily II)/rhodanese-related sulfurtransferase
MIFETVAAGGCRSYLVGCPDQHVAALIDPHQGQVERYKSLAAQHGLRIAFVVDTHTHADHFSAAKQMGAALGAPIVMHPASPAPFADLRLEDGEALAVGTIRLKALHTPGHTADSMCLVGRDRVFTGDTLLIGATGRTDLPTGDPGALYDSLFEKVLKLDPTLSIHPAHHYKGVERSTIGAEIVGNPRLQEKERAAFVAMMQSLNLSAPDHLTEALRTNMSGGRTIAQLLSEAGAAVPFIALDELNARLAARRNDAVILDVREKDAFESSHIPGARHLPRGQLELRVNEAFPDPTVLILTYCEVGKISTLAAATLRQLGFTRAAALDGGMKAWREAGYPTESGPA